MVLDPPLYGFRSGYSCETQLVVTAHDLLNFSDQNRQVDVVILDFSKAFDTVPHRKLLHKLDAYGIRGPLHTWIANFLTKRKMNVVVEGEKSPSVHVGSGVPQGTVLRPLLFLCHINDLPKHVASRIRLFADDCLLYRPINSPQDHQTLQQDLNNLQISANDWGMKFNAKKMLPAKHQVQIKTLLHHQRSNPQTSPEQSIFGNYIF